jgi:hypothetical protein
MDEDSSKVFTDNVSRCGRAMGSTFGREALKMESSSRKSSCPELNGREPELFSSSPLSSSSISK